MNITIDYIKQIELNDTNDTVTVSRWTTRITIVALNNSLPILGLPVFYVAKEGTDANETAYLNVTSNESGNFHKITH
jgi:hypothetical protein